MESLGHDSHSLPKEKMLGEVEVVIRTEILAAFFLFIYSLPQKSRAWDILGSFTLDFNFRDVSSVS